MATQERTEYETVEKTVTIKVCDYCQLVTEDDIADDEEFGEVLLNPNFSRPRGMHRPNDILDHVMEQQLSTVTGEIITRLESQETIEDTFGEDATLNEPLEDVVEQVVRSALQNYRRQIVRRMERCEDDTADLCPNCVDKLFGDRPDRMFADDAGVMCDFADADN